MAMIFKDENGNVIAEVNETETPQEETQPQVEAQAEDVEPIVEAEPQQQQEEPQVQPEIDEDKVRNFLKEKYQIDSIEDVLKKPEQLPEDVDAFLR